MKPEVKPRQGATLPAEAAPEEASLLSLEGLRRNRALFVGIGAAVAVALLAFGAIAIQRYLTSRAEEKAWAAYGSLHKGLSRKPGLQVETSSGPEELARDIEAGLSELKGTSAEPWALFDLGNAYFAQGDPKRALEVFSDLKARFGEHYLTNQKASYHSTVKIDAAIEDCTKEIEWLKTHEKLTPKQPEDSAPKPVGSTDAPDSPESTDAPAAPEPPEKKP